MNPPGRRRRWLAWWCAVAFLGTVAGAVWFALPWQVSYSLAGTRESLPVSARLNAVWWNADGTRALAVGDEGGVVERKSELGDSAGTWSQIEAGTTEQLRAVAGGEGPWRHPLWTAFLDDRHERVFAAGRAGTVLDCTGARCEPLAAPTKVALNAVAVGGRQAFVVGERGTVLHVVPDPRPHTIEPESSVAIQRAETPEIDATLNSIVLQCTDQDEQSRCLAVAVGNAGTVLEGTGSGRCDEGHRLSGEMTMVCRWTWSLVTVPLSGTLKAVWVDAHGIVAADEAGQRMRRAPDGTWDRENDAAPQTWPEFYGAVDVDQRKVFVHRRVREDAWIAYGVAVYFKAAEWTRFRRARKSLPPARQASGAMRRYWYCWRTAK